MASSALTTLLSPAFTNPPPSEGALARPAASPWSPGNNALGPQIGVCWPEIHICLIVNILRGKKKEESQILVKALLILYPP